jgi:DNA repair protein RadC
MNASTPHYHGHRERLRQRLIDAGADNLPDYELVEVILFASNARADVKPLAKHLLERFGGFAELLSAEPDALAAAGLGLAGIAALKAAREAALRLMRSELHQRPVVNSWDKLIDYCTAYIAHGKVEEFHILFLDRKNVLIRHERQQRGTVDHTPVYTREVVKRALELQGVRLDPGAQPSLGRPDPLEGGHRGDQGHRQSRRCAQCHRARPPDHRPRSPQQPARPRTDLSASEARRV